MYEAPHQQEPTAPSSSKSYCILDSSFLEPLLDPQTHWDALVNVHALQLFALFKYLYPPHLLEHICLRQHLMQCSGQPSSGYPAKDDLEFTFQKRIYCECVHAIACVWQSEDNLWESPLFFHHAGSQESGTEIIRFGSKCLYMLNHLTSLNTLDF